MVLSTATRNLSSLEKGEYNVKVNSPTCAPNEDVVEVTRSSMKILPSPPGGVTSLKSRILTPAIPTSSLLYEMRPRMKPTGVGIGVGVGVPVGIGVVVGDGFTVGVGVAVGIGVVVGVGDGFPVGVGVAVGIGVAVGVGDGFPVGVGVAVGIGVAVGVGFELNIASVPAIFGE